MWSFAEDHANGCSTNMAGNYYSPSVEKYSDMDIKNNTVYGSSDEERETKEKMVEEEKQEWKHS